LRRNILLLVTAVLITNLRLAGQTVTPPSETQQTQAATPSLPAQRSQPQVPPPITLPPAPQLPTTGPLQKLTIQDAENLAIKNNPQISVNRLIYLASNQITREQKSAYYPSITGNLTAVGGQQGSRIAAGSLNAPRLLNRAAGGLALSQLIYDFGRTNNLVAMSALRAKAADMNTVATANQIKLAVDQAFYNALLTLSEEKVAEQTVSTRKVVSDQITTLYQNKLRSELDVSFADANLAQAQLLLLDAENNYQASLSQLTQILGYSGQQQFELVDTEPELKPPPDAVSQLEDEAFSNRPEIAAQSYEYQAAQHFQKAERDLLFPTVSALGIVGDAFNGSLLNGRREHQRADLQWFSISRTLEGSVDPRASRQRATSRPEGPHRQRCAHQLAERNYRIQPHRGQLAVSKPGKSCAQSLSDTLQHRA
jgi:outer membrane protein TolC